MIQNARSVLSPSSWPGRTESGAHAGRQGGTSGLRPGREPRLQERSGAAQETSPTSTALLAPGSSTPRRSTRSSSRRSPERRVVTLVGAGCFRPGFGDDCRTRLAGQLGARIPGAFWFGHAQAQAAMNGYDGVCLTPSQNGGFSQCHSRIWGLHLTGGFNQIPDGLNAHTDGLFHRRFWAEPVSRILIV